MHCSSLWSRCVCVCVWMGGHAYSSSLWSRWVWVGGWVGVGGMHAQQLCGCGVWGVSGVTASFLGGPATACHCLLPPNGRIIHQPPTCSLLAKTPLHSPVPATACYCYCLQDLLASTGIHPKQVGILIVNCSLFNPTPSLSAMVINHFKMRSNIISYNLSGRWRGTGVRP